MLIAIILSLPFLYAIACLVRALINCCDGDTAAARLPPNAFAGKCVWVTGASSGLGKELAIQLGSRQKARVILSARRADALQETKQEIVAAGGSAKDIHILPLDMEQLAALPAAAEKACALFGGIDVLINNAGISQRELGCNTDFSVDVHLTHVNFLGPACLAKAVLPSMATRGGGTLINISSLAGKVGVPLRTAYCGSKHAVVGFFDALRVEEHARGSGITVTNVCPGSVRTNIARNAKVGDGSARGESDVNIESGLDPSWACERILAAAASGVDECWIAAGLEMFLAYVAQYAPGFCKWALKKMAKKKIAETLAAVKKE